MDKTNNHSEQIPYKPDEKDLVVARAARAKGFEYTARYIEMFGLMACRPDFNFGLKREYDNFYKTCVEEGHPWDWYFELPEDMVF